MMQIEMRGNVKRRRMDGWMVGSGFAGGSFS
jgi:hypothetical protein